MADYDLRQVALLVFGAVVAWEGFYMLFKVVALDGASWWLSGLPGIVVGTLMLIVGGLIAYGTYLEMGSEGAPDDVEEPDWSVPRDGGDRGGERVTDPSAGGHPEPVRDAAEEGGGRRTVTDTTAGDEAPSWSSSGGARDGDGDPVSGDGRDGDGIRRTRVDEAGDGEEGSDGRGESGREPERDREEGGRGREEPERGEDAGG